MSSTVFGPADVTVVFVNRGKVGTAAFGASDEGFGALAVGNGMTQTQATAALDESGAILEGADGGLAAEEVGRGAAHQFETIPIWVIEGEDYAGMDFASKVLLAAEPPWFRENSTAGTYLIFHKFSAEDRRGGGVSVSITNHRNPSQDNLTVPFSRGSAAIRTKGSEENVVIFRNGVQGRLALEFKDEIFLDLLRGPAAGDYLDLSCFVQEIVLDRTDETAWVAFDMFWK
jgi:hypothetical protein